MSSRNGPGLSDENVPFVTSQEDETAHAIALAEAEVLKARRENRRYLRCTSTKVVLFCLFLRHRFPLVAKVALQRMHIVQAVAVSPLMACVICSLWAHARSMLATPPLAVGMMAKADAFSLSHKVIR